MVKQFLYKASIFLLIFLGINAGLAYCYIHLVMEHSLARKKEETFLAKTSPIDFLFIGDSHTAAAINARIIPNSVNYSGSGESYLQNYYKLKNTDIISKTPIKTVVLPLDFHSFSSFRKYRLTDENYWAKKVNLLEMAISKQELVWFKKWLKGYFFPYMGELRNVFSVLNREQKIIDGVEHRKGQFLEMENTMEDVTTAMERHFKGSEVFDEDLLSNFHQAIEYCENTDKNLILLRYPISNAYYEQLENYIDFVSYQNQFKALQKQIPSNVRYLDFSLVFKEQQEYFFDADHLNMQGAEAFSKILKDSLVTVRIK